mmetsp:Transcript_25664/g.51806  ORF Transcript_25664/g.51806 Transcript_25664/m.51806 type:complete len:212 (+) Transcript_25664:678-1313(+)
MARRTLGLSSSAARSASSATAAASPGAPTSMSASAAASRTSSSSCLRCWATSCTARASPLAMSPSVRPAARRAASSSMKLQRKSTGVPTPWAPAVVRCFNSTSCRWKLAPRSSFATASTDTTMVNRKAFPSSAQREARLSASSRTVVSWTSCWYFWGMDHCVSMWSFAARGVTSDCNSKSMESPATFDTVILIMPRLYWAAEAKLEGKTEA